MVEPVFEPLKFLTKGTIEEGEGGGLYMYMYQKHHFSANPFLGAKFWMSVHTRITVLFG